MSLLLKSVLLTLILSLSYVRLTESVAATIYAGGVCSGAVQATIENVPNNFCYSFHGRGSDVIIPTSGRVNCATETTDSSWTASMYGILAVDPTYTCAGQPTLSPSGVGAECVQLLGGQYSARVSCAPEAGSVKYETAGGIEAQIDQTTPFVIKIAPAEGNITAGRYLQVSYSLLGEINGAGSVVADAATTPYPTFHSIPLTDLMIATNVDFIADSTADYAFVGYYGGLPQTYTTTITAGALNLNFLAKSDFSIASYPIVFPGQAGPRDVCLRASDGNAGVDCTDFPVTAGTVKSAFGLYNWTYASTATKWRIQYRLQLVGLTGAAVYFNGNTANVPPFAGQITSITWKSSDRPFGFEFTYNVQQKFNKGNNVFDDATISSSGTAADLLLNVDIPLNLLNNSGLEGWWLYDPDVTVTTAQGTTTPSAGESSSGGNPGSSGGNPGSSSSAPTIASSLNVFALVVVVLMMMVLRA